MNKIIVLRGAAFFFIPLLIFLFVSAFVFFSQKKNNEKRRLQAEILKKYVLNDLCLSTSSPYTRLPNASVPFDIFADLPGYHAHGANDFFFLSKKIFEKDKAKSTAAH